MFGTTLKAANIVQYIYTSLSTNRQTEQIKELLRLRGRFIAVSTFSLELTV